MNKAMPLIREYANMLYFNFIDFQKELQERLYQLPTTSNIAETVELEIIYSEKPQIPLLNYLIEFSTLTDPDCPMPNLVRTERGSFHEYHEIAVAIIPYLQTLFSFLGVVVPIIIYKKQKQDHEKERGEESTTAAKEKDKIEITVTTKSADHAPLLIPNTNSITADTNVMTTDVIKILDLQPMRSISGFGGYNNQNIQSITIKFN